MKQSSWKPSSSLVVVCLVLWIAPTNTNHNSVEAASFLGALEHNRFYHHPTTSPAASQWTCSLAASAAAEAGNDGDDTTRSNKSPWKKSTRSRIPAAPLPASKLHRFRQSTRLSSAANNNKMDSTSNNNQQNNNNNNNNNNNKSMNIGRTLMNQSPQESNKQDAVKALQELLDDAILVSVNGSSSTGGGSSIQSELQTLIQDMSFAVHSFKVNCVTQKERTTMTTTNQELGENLIPSSSSLSSIAKAKSRVAERLEEALCTYMKIVDEAGGETSSPAATEERYRMETLAAEYQDLVERERAQEAKTDPLLLLDDVDDETRIASVHDGRQEKDRLLLVESFRKRFEHVSTQLSKAAAAEVTMGVTPQGSSAEANTEIVDKPLSKSTDATDSAEPKVGQQPKPKTNSIFDKVKSLTASIMEDYTQTPVSVPEAAAAQASSNTGGNSLDPMFFAKHSTAAVKGPPKKALVSNSLASKIKKLKTNKDSPTKTAAAATGIVEKGNSNVDTGNLVKVATTPSLNKTEELARTAIANVLASLEVGRNAEEEDDDDPASAAMKILAENFFNEENSIWDSDGKLRLDLEDVASAIRVAIRRDALLGTSHGKELVFESGDEATRNDTASALVLGNELMRSRSSTTALFASATGRHGPPGAPRKAFQAKSLIKKVHGRLKPASTKPTPQFIDKVPPRKDDPNNDNDDESDNGRSKMSSAIQKRGKSKFSFFAAYKAVRPATGKEVLPYQAAKPPPTSDKERTPYNVGAAPDPDHAPRGTRVFVPASDSSSYNSQSSFVASAPRFSGTGQMVNAKEVKGTISRKMVNAKEVKATIDKEKIFGPMVTGPPTVQEIRKKLLSSKSAYKPQKYHQSGTSTSKNYQAPPSAPRSVTGTKSSSGTEKASTEKPWWKSKADTPFISRSETEAMSTSSRSSAADQASDKPWWKSAVDSSHNDTIPYTPPSFPTAHHSSEATASEMEVPTEAKNPPTPRARGAKPQVNVGSIFNEEGTGTPPLRPPQKTLSEKPVRGESDLKPKISVGSNFNQGDLSSLNSAYMEMKYGATPPPEEPVSSEIGPMPAKEPFNDELEREKFFTQDSTPGAVSDRRVSTQPYTPSEEDYRAESVTPRAATSGAPDTKVPSESVSAASSTTSETQPHVAPVNPRDDKFSAMRNKFLSTSFFAEASGSGPRTVSDQRVSVQPFGMSPAEDDPTWSTSVEGSSPPESTTTPEPSGRNVSAEKVSPEQYGSSVVGISGGPSSQNDAMPPSSSPPAPEPSTRKYSSKKVPPKVYSTGGDFYGGPATMPPLGARSSPPPSSRPKPESRSNVSASKVSTAPYGQGGNYGGSAPQSERQSRNVSKRKVSAVPYGQEDGYAGSVSMPPLGARSAYSPPSPPTPARQSLNVSTRKVSPEPYTGRDYADSSSVAMPPLGANSARSKPIVSSRKRVSDSGEDDDGRPRVMVGGGIGDVKMPSVSFNPGASAVASSPFGSGGQSVSSRKVSTEPYRPPQEENDDDSPSIIIGDGTGAVLGSGLSSAPPPLSSTGQSVAPRRVSTEPYSPSAQDDESPSIIIGDGTGAVLGSALPSSSQPPAPSSTGQNVSTRQVSREPYAASGSSTSTGQNVSTRKVSTEPYAGPETVFDNFISDKGTDGAIVEASPKKEPREVSIPTGDATSTATTYSQGTTTFFSDSTSGPRTVSDRRVSITPYGFSPPPTTQDESTEQVSKEPYGSTADLDGTSSPSSSFASPSEFQEVPVSEDDFYDGSTNWGTSLSSSSSSQGSADHFAGPSDSSQITSSSVRTVSEAQNNVFVGQESSEKRSDSPPSPFTTPVFNIQDAPEGQAPAVSSETTSNSSPFSSQPESDIFLVASEASGWSSAASNASEAPFLPTSDGGLDSFQHATEEHFGSEESSVISKGYAPEGQIQPPWGVTGTQVSTEQGPSTATSFVSPESEPSVPNQGPTQPRQNFPLPISQYSVESAHDATPPSTGEPQSSIQSYEPSPTVESYREDVNLGTSTSACSSHVPELPTYGASNQESPGQYQLSSPDSENPPHGASDFGSANSFPERSDTNYLQGDASSSQHFQNQSQAYGYYDDANSVDPSSYNAPAMPEGTYPQVSSQQEQTDDVGSFGSEGGTMFSPPQDESRNQTEYYPPTAFSPPQEDTPRNYSEYHPATSWGRSHFGLGGNNYLDALSSTTHKNPPSDSFQPPSQESLATSQAADQFQNNGGSSSYFEHYPTESTSGSNNTSFASSSSSFETPFSGYSSSTSDGSHQAQNVESQAQSWPGYTPDANGSPSGNSQYDYLGQSSSQYGQSAPNANEAPSENNQYSYLSQSSSPYGEPTPNANGSPSENNQYSYLSQSSSPYGEPTPNANGSPSENNQYSYLSQASSPYGEPTPNANGSPSANNQTNASGQSSFSYGGFGTQSPFGKRPSDVEQSSVPQAYLDAIAASRSSTKLEATSSSSRDSSCATAEPTFWGGATSSSSSSSSVESTAGIPQAYLDAIAASQAASSRATTAREKSSSIFPDENGPGVLFTENQPNQHLSESPQSSTYTSYTTTNNNNNAPPAPTKSTFDEKDNNQGWSQVPWDHADDSSKTDKNNRDPFIL